MQWNPEGPKMPESAFSPEMLLYSNSFSPTAHFSGKVSIDSFLLESDYSLPNINKIALLIRIGNQIDQNWQKAFGIENLDSNLS